MFLPVSQWLDTKNAKHVITTFRLPVLARKSKFQYMELPVYFISDLHLSLTHDEQEKMRQEKFFRFLDHVSETGGTIYIVGDLFDFYFEYKHVIPKVYFPVYRALYNLKLSGVDIHFVTGNHDHWIMNFVNNTLTTLSHLDDTILELNGKRFYITHGDGILSWDRGYRLLKAIIRNRLFIWLYRWLHPNIGYGIAHWIANRGHHYTYSDEYNSKVLKELKVFADTISADGFDYILTGHYHQAKVENVNGGKLVILGDWLQFFSYAVYDGEDIELKFWEAHA